MRSVHAAALAAVAALAPAGCAAQQPSSSGNFQGAERDVAKVIDDLKSAAARADGDKICGRIVTSQLAEQLAAGTASCSDEMKKAARDAGDYDVEVTDVTVTGSTAKAQVRQEDGGTATFELARGSDGWRLSSFG